MAIAKPNVSAMPLEFSLSVAASANGMRRDPAGSSAYQLLRDVTLKDDGTRKDWKVIHLDGAENVTGVRIRIDAIYTGSKFKTDVCISEIMFVRNAGQ